MPRVLTTTSPLATASVAYKIHDAAAALSRGAAIDSVAAAVKDAAATPQGEKPATTPPGGEEAGTPSKAATFGSKSENKSDEGIPPHGAAPDAAAEEAAGKEKAPPDGGIELSEPSTLMGDAAPNGANN